MQRRRRGQNTQTTQNSPSPQPTRTRRQRQIVAFTSSSEDDDNSSIKEIKVNRPNTSENGLIDIPLDAQNQNYTIDLYDWRHKGSGSPQNSPNAQSSKKSEFKESEADDKSNKHGTTKRESKRSDESKNNSTYDDENDSNNVERSESSSHEKVRRDKDSSSDIYHLTEEEEKSTPHKVIRKRRVRKVHTNQNETQQEEVKNDENITKEKKQKVEIAQQQSREPKQEKEEENLVEVKTSSSKISLLTQSANKKNKAKPKRKGSSSSKTDDFPEEAPDIYSNDPNVVTYIIKREKKLMGMNPPSFYLLLDDDLVYHTKITEIGDKKGYVINAEERIDRFSRTFVGYLLKHEMNTRFTLKTPVGKSDESAEKEVLGLYFYHHEDKTRHAFLVEAPENQSYFPGTKELSLSRLAKSMTVPESFLAYTGCSLPPKSDSIKSIKNMELFESGKEVPIVSVLKIEKDTYKLRMYKKYSALFGFAFALGSIITKPSLIGK